jgi:hypothetical protein
VRFRLTLVLTDTLIDVRNTLIERQGSEEFMSQTESINYKCFTICTCNVRTKEYLSSSMGVSNKLLFHNLVSYLIFNCMNWIKIRIECLH